eukprot:gene3019-3477_t
MALIKAGDEQLVNFFKNLQSKKYMCDILFKVGELKEDVYGIKAILAARSSVFAEMLCTNTTRSVADGGKVKKSKRTPSKGKHKITTITLPEYNYEEVCCFMEYLHSGTCSVGPKIMIGLMMLADDFKVRGLKEFCLQMIKETLSEFNTLYFWKDLFRFNSKRFVSDIWKLLTNFLGANAEKILLGGTIVILTRPELLEALSFKGLTLSEHGKFHAALIWTKAHMQMKPSGETLQSVFAPFLERIKLKRIPIQYLVEDVRRTKVIPERLLAHACAHNEVKESYKSISEANGPKEDDHGRFSKAVKHANASSDTDLRHLHQKSRFMTSQVVGIYSSTGSRSSSNKVSFVDSNEYSNKDEHRRVHNSKGDGYARRKKKQSKHRYDVSRMSHSCYDNEPQSSASKPVKATRISASTPCLDLMF